MDQGNEEWMYTAHFFPQEGRAHRQGGSLEAEDDGEGKKEDLFTKRSHIWICGRQSDDTKTKTRLIRHIVNDSPMGAIDLRMQIDPPGTRRGHGWGVL